MVGLVLVSHSAALAAAVVEFVHRMVGPDVRALAAGGCGDGRQDLGTDAMAILAAIQELDAPEGVLVLVDLGSAVLSAETALEFLEDAQRERVVVCSAPLVEGALAAATLTRLGAPLAEVRTEAEGALRQKQTHLGGPAPAAGTPPAAAGAAAAPGGGEEGAALEFVVENPHGLHARPAAKIVGAVASHEAEVFVANLRTGAPPASARSLTALSCLDVRRGDTVRVTARGPAAEAALQALRELHAQRFGEPAWAAEAEPGAAPPEPVPPPPPSAAPDGEPLRGEPLSEGFAWGPLLLVGTDLPEVPRETAADPAGEVRKLRAAAAAVGRELADQERTLRANVGAAGAAILSAHQALLRDPALLDRAAGRIDADRVTAAFAWQQVAREVAAAYRRLPTEVMRERAGDVADLESRVLRQLGPRRAPARAQPAGGPAPILVFGALVPGDVAELDPGQVAGVISTTPVGRTSHAAILLRSLGIPAVSRVPAAAAGGASHPPREGAPAALDGHTGEVWLRPDETVRAELRRRGWEEPAAPGPEDSPAAADAPGREAAALGTRLRDGHRVELAANVASPAEARLAARAGAEAIGLVRTEFLFFDRTEAPTEEEQTAALTAVSEPFRDRPVLVRTLDAGGDKPLPFLPVPPEANPFLGVRGLRLSLRHEALFLTQLRAVLRAGADRRLHVMFPMVTEADEIRRGRACLERAHAELAAAGVAHAWPVPVGTMIEVPAAALNARALAAEVDFFSVGTNDLTQYTLAAERGHPELTGLADALHPAVTRLVALVVRAAAARGKWVGVCGEAAADPAVAAVLVGLGVKELSVGARAITKLRAFLARVDRAAVRRLARRCLHADSALQARAWAEEWRQQVAAAGDGPAPIPPTL